MMICSRGGGTCTLFKNMLAQISTVFLHGSEKLRTDKQNLCRTNEHFFQECTRVDLKKNYHDQCPDNLNQIAKYFNFFLSIRFLILHTKYVKIQSFPKKEKKYSMHDIPL